MSTARNNLRKQRLRDKKLGVKPYVTKAAQTVRNSPINPPYITHALAYIKSKDKDLAANVIRDGVTDRIVRVLAQGLLAEQ